MRVKRILFDSNVWNYLSNEHFQLIKSTMLYPTNNFKIYTSPVNIYESIHVALSAEDKQKKLGRGCGHGYRQLKSTMEKMKLAKRHILPKPWDVMRYNIFRFLGRKPFLAKMDLEFQEMIEELSENPTKVNEYDYQEGVVKPMESIRENFQKDLDETINFVRLEIKKHGYAPMLTVLDPLVRLKIIGELLRKCKMTYSKNELYSVLVSWKKILGLRSYLPRYIDLVYQGITQGRKADISDFFDLEFTTYAGLTKIVTKNYKDFKSFGKIVPDIQSFTNFIHEIS